MPSVDQETGLPNDIQVNYCRLLQERFNYLTDLRKMTAHRHITLISVVGALIAGIVQFGDPRQQQVVESLVFPTSLVLLTLGVCVTVYDAMIRVRASAVMLEISRTLENSIPIQRITRSGLLARAFGYFDEDFFFFSQILIVNSLAALPLSTREDSSTGHLTNALGLPGLMAWAVAAIVYSLIWFGIRLLYQNWGPPNNWFPKA